MRRLQKHRNLTLVFILLMCCVPSQQTCADQGSGKKQTADCELSAEQIFRALTANEWQPVSVDPVKGKRIEGRVVFKPEGCAYSSNLDSMPGPRATVEIRGVSSAGTVRPKEPEVGEIASEFFEKTRTGLTEPFNSPYHPFMGDRHLKWNFKQDCKTGGYLFFEDGSALRFALLPNGNLDLGETIYSPSKKTLKGPFQGNRSNLAPVDRSFFKRLCAVGWKLNEKPSVSSHDSAPLTIEFGENGHFLVSEGKTIRENELASWSLVNHEGMKLIFHPGADRRAWYPFDDEKIFAAARQQNLSSLQRSFAQSPGITISLGAHDELYVAKIPAGVKSGILDYCVQFTPVASKLKGLVNHD